MKKCQASALRISSRFDHSSAPAGLTGGILWQINLAITSIYEVTVNLVSVILFVAMLCYGTIKTVSYTHLTLPTTPYV